MERELFSVKTMNNWYVVEKTENGYSIIYSTNQEVLSDWFGFQCTEPILEKPIYIMREKGGRTSCVKKVKRIM